MTGSQEASIRRAVPQDAEAIAEVLRSAFVPYFHLYTAGAYDATVLDPERIHVRMAEGPVWVVESAATIVGTAAAYVASGYVHVRGMAVRPGAQGEKVATRLLAQVERFAAENSQTVLALYTTPFLHDAIRLYEARGFTASGEAADLHGTKLLRMTKRLETAK